MCFGPDIPLLLRLAFKEMSAASVAGILEPSGTRDFFIHQEFGNSIDPHTVERKVENFADNPGGFLINHQLVLDVRVFPVTKRSQVIDPLTVEKFCPKRALNLAAGIFCHELIRISPSIQAEQAHGYKPN